ncbi:MAG TPA: UPF0182 family protein [Acidimicrobiales bacterium]|nr:UPF0182 family protein [Acidimicrobiales bacterium]
MRVPNEAVLSTPSPMRRYQLWLLGGILIVILLLVAVQGLADLFTNYLWYRSVRADDVWRTMTATKLELLVFFTGLFFLACWFSLLVVDRVAPRALFMSPEQEFVRRYQALVGRHRFGLRTVVSFFLALILGNGTTSQWQHWLLFLHGGTFGKADPVFHKDIGYFVFKLPFLSFLVDWTQVALIVLAIVCAAAYYMNGGLRFSGPSPRVDPRATAHFSAIFAVLALVRAAGYFYVDRYALELSRGSLFQGADYTDLHVRLPALNLLAIVALTAFVLFVLNLYARGWMLPIVAAGLWAFVAIAIGVVFPWAVQSLEVTPAASSLELPYISRNITATRAAYGLQQGAYGAAGVSSTPFQGANDATPAVISNDAASLEDVDLWDPSVSSQTYQKLQQLKGFYTINGLSLDRYNLDSGASNSKELTPVVIGVREISPSSLASSSWVNAHLVYTHGYGVVMAPANTTFSSPTFALKNIPVQEALGAPLVQQPDVYYGVGETGYVVVDTRQPEYNPQSSSPTLYKGGGGIRIGSVWQKLAFALRFHDFNLLVSRLVTPDSRIIFNQDVRTLVQKVAPFLQIDANPYPVINGGQLDWVVDAYTTTSYYPYSQTVSTPGLSPGSGLGGDFNYVRNSVKAVVNAYTGQVTLYAMGESSASLSSDPILRAWERIFPGMFKPSSEMGAILQAHLRYPQDLLAVEATVFGRYHLLPDQAPIWYSNLVGGTAWQLALTGPGSPAVYQLLQLPGQSAPTFNAFAPLVPLGSSAQNLTTFLVANCSYSSYGQLTAYEVPAAITVFGPATADAQIDASHDVSSEETLLGLAGSRVAFGPTLVIPIDQSLLYVRALFVLSSSNAVPQLQYVVVYYGGKVEIGTTLLGPGGALTQAIGNSIAAVGSTNITQNIASEITTAENLETAAYAALKAGDLATYGADEASLKTLLAQIDMQVSKLEAHKGSSTSSSTTSTTTTTTVPKASSITRGPASGSSGSGASVGGA